jgi:ribonuclease Z
MRHLFHPVLVNGPQGDPGLFVDFEDEGRALLFDIGDVTALPPRKLLRISHVFVSHAHMDHFAGLDHLLRVALARKERIVLVGGPSFIERVGHKLAAYTWNVVQRYEVALTLEVHELGTDGQRQRADFCSRSGFCGAPAPAPARAGDVVLDEPLFRVRATFVDHATPCLAWLMEEKARPRVAKDRLAALGVSTGAWLRELKQAVLADAPPSTPIRLQWRDRLGEHEMTRTVGELRDVILDVTSGLRVGYVTDLRFTEDNVRALQTLMPGVDRLYIEAVFLDEDRDHALRKHHLTARQAGEIARRLGARSVVPFHFSPRYEGRSAALATELMEAWGGAIADPSGRTG